jgi:nitrate/TMAO reductase-like tetraheme cytochrome c subunit
MQWVAKEHAASGHHVNRTGVQAGCHDCHIPHNYPELLWYKSKAGVKDVIGEVGGVISTEEKFKKERTRMAKLVWTEFRETDSANCRTCHAFTPEVLAKQKEFAGQMHAGRKAEKKTCIDCHTGIAHEAPSE